MFIQHWFKAFLASPSDGRVFNFPLDKKTLRIFDIC